MIQLYIYLYSFSDVFLIGTGSVLIWKKQSTSGHLMKYLLHIFDPFYNRAIHNDFLSIVSMFDSDSIYFFIIVHYTLVFSQRL